MHKMIQPIHARDIHSAFLLLNLAFNAPAGAPCPQGSEVMPLGFASVPPELDMHSRFEDMPWQLGHASLWQMQANLLLIVDSDEPEFVHQARIGWRRLRGTARLLKNIRGLPEMPQTEALLALLQQLRDLRDVDVARLEILPCAALQLGPKFHSECRALITLLDDVAAQRRSALRFLLQDAKVGAALWQQVLWLMQLRDARPSPDIHVQGQAVLCRWASDCIADIHHRFKRAMAKSKDKATRHRARIWAKRLRYAVEDLDGLLGSKARNWLQEARGVQAGLGAQRDLQMTAALAKQLGYKQLAPRILRTDSGGA